MWPELLDMTLEESKRILRRVELEAYSTVVSAFRAQGDMSKDKKRILLDLQQMLSISTERHRAEVRRAVNDEKLATIADNISPSNSTQEWLIEGRRLVPLMPRLVPQTAFTVTANQVANMQAEKNASLPSPSQTGIRDMSIPPVSSPPPTPRISRPSSPTSNVVVLPSGLSIHIKGGLNTEDDEDIQIRKRRRSTSTESLVSPTGTPVPQVTYTTTMANMPTISPKKITISKSPQAQPRVVASGSQTQKVILVSSQGQTPQGVIPQKSVSMPIVRSTVSTGTSTSHMNKSIIFPSSSVATNTNIGNVVTMATPSSITNTTSTVVSPLAASSVGTSTTAFLTPTISVSRPRFKTVPRQKILQLPPPRPGVVIPMGPQPVQPSPQSIQGLKSVTKNTPTIQIRQEGGMKIITQNIPGGTSKILPKPSQMTTPSGTPVVVVSAGSSSSSGTVRAISSVTGTPTGTKVLNIQTQGGKIISAPRGPSVVTVNPKTLHLTAVKNAAGISGTKPNVIVVQKTQARRPSASLTHGGTQGKSTTAVISSPFEKELVSFLQKQDPTKQYVVTTTTANFSRATDSQRKVIVTTSAHGDLAKQLSQTLRSKTDSSQTVPSNILQDLIQAAGIVPDGNQDNQEVTINLDEAQLAALTSVSQGTTQTKVSQPMPSNEWFEYDVTDEQGNTYTHTAESADTAAAIQSLLDMQSNGSAQKPKVTVQRSASVDIGQLSDHLNQQQFYTIEQAMTILNQTDKEPGATSYIQADSQSQTSLDTGDSDQGEMLTAIPLRNINVPITMTTESQHPTAVTSVPLDTNLSGQHGDLDPQTGMFYVDKINSNAVTALKTGGKQEVVIVKSGGRQTVQLAQEGSTKNYDLLSSSLAQAQIDLDPFQFIEEVQQQSSAKSDEGPMNVVVHTEQVNTEPAKSVESMPNVQSEQVVVQKVITAPTANTSPSIRIQPSSFVPIQEVVKTTVAKPSTINITASKQVHVATCPSVTMIPRSSASSIHVTVEPSGLDTSHMKIEDFTSQQLTEKGDYVGVDHMEEIGTVDSPPSTAGSSGLSDSQGESSQFLDSQQLQGKRKRKALSVDDVQSSPPPGSAAGSWVRAALGVLNKVSKYRGMNRDKTDLNAATWFVQPVDPADAPDYYTIVENPMDFGTIKKKLEAVKYGEFDEFHSDMVLVRDNCRLYNPEQSLVRKDCDEVFAFYQQEYDKLMEKWQKTHIASPISKKPRTDRSPIRP